MGEERQAKTIWKIGTGNKKNRGRLRKKLNNEVANILKNREFNWEQAMM